MSAATRAVSLSQARAQLAALVARSSSDPDVLAAIADLRQLLASSSGVIVSVKDQGAAGDGIQDDAPGITAAIAAVEALGGGSVYMPAGTYKIMTTLPLGSNVTVFGDGIGATTIKLGATGVSGFSNYPSLVAVSRCRVRDLTIDGDYNNVADGGNDNYQHGIYAHLVSDSVFERIEFARIWYVGIENYNNSNRNTIRGNRFVNVGDKVTIVAGLGGTYYGVGNDFAVSDTLIADNVFETCGHGVNLFGDGGTIARCVIRGNRFVGMSDFAIYGRQGVFQLIVEGNHANGLGAGFFNLYDDPAIAHNGGQSAHIVVAGNTVVTWNTSNAAGIQCIGVVAQVGVHVVDNVINGDSATGTDLGVVVASAAAGGGAGATGYTQTGAIIARNYLGGAFPTYEAVLVNACADTLVADNVIVGGGATTGILVAAGSARTIVSRNVYNGCATSVNDAGTATIIEGVVVAWTPAWTASGVAPALGNGSILGRYTRSGRRVSIDLVLTIGGTTTLGTGAWFFSVPVAGAAAPVLSVGVAQMLDNGVADYIGVARLDPGAGQIRVITSAGAVVGPAAPHAWGAGDQLLIHLDYET